MAAAAVDDDAELGAALAASVEVGPLTSAELRALEACVWPSPASSSSSAPATSHHAAAAARGVWLSQGLQPGMFGRVEGETGVLLRRGAETERKERE